MSSLSPVGLLLGALLFAASLTPSLIPRSWLFQGALGGVAFAAGYGIGIVGRWLWRFLELPRGGVRLRSIAIAVAAALAAVIVIVFLARAAAWQNSVRAEFGLEPVQTAHALWVALLAIVVAVVLIALGRLVVALWRFASAGLERFTPPRLARMLGLVVVLALLVTAVDGVLFRSLLAAVDRSARALDALFEPGVERPTDPLAAGSAASLLEWRDLGRAGREYVASGPTAADITAQTGRPALDPLRVYVGLNAAASTAERARLALEELERVDAFERSVLVVAVPTGTGWMDWAATDTLEYLHHGDVATVALQYSYLTSPVSLLVEPGYASESARAMFRAVYERWTGMPETRRPRLYLYGISLGAIGSQASAQLYEVIGDPLQGALWAGPPFASPLWRQITDAREPGSPPWRPRFGDGSFVRFTNHGGGLDMHGEWGPLRIVYLQHASDPIVFFDPESLYRRPAWMHQPRGPDVSAEFRWYPVVTFLQLLVDMAIGLDVPIGHGHLYAPDEYIDAWVAVTAPEGWSEAEIAGLKALFEKQR